MIDLLNAAAWFILLVLQGAPTEEYRWTAVACWFLYALLIQIIQIKRALIEKAAQHD